MTVLAHTSCLFGEIVMAVGSRCGGALTALSHPFPCQVFRFPLLLSACVLLAYVCVLNHAQRLVMTDVVRLGERVAVLQCITVCCSARRDDV